MSSPSDPSGPRGEPQGGWGWGPAPEASESKNPARRAGERSPGSGRPFVVGIAGGSGAGKTALARALTVSLGPERVAFLCQDAYYRNRGELLPSERSRLNYDVPDALDQPLFRADLEALRGGRTITPPHYSFATHCRVGPAPPVEPRDIVIVEGILLFHDRAVRDALDLRIFVDAPEGLRLTRRLHRDTVERGRTADAVLGQCRATVLPAHARYVEPSRAWADLVLLNAGRLEAVAEVAATIIRDRLARRPDVATGAHAA